MDGSKILVMFLSYIIYLLVDVIPWDVCLKGGQDTKWMCFSRVKPQANILGKEPLQERFASEILRKASNLHGFWQLL